MAASTNQITVIGNLTRDPELRYTKNNNALVSLGIAVNRRVNRNGTWEDALDGYFNVSLWGEAMAKNVSQSLHKGDRVIVMGRLTQSNYQDQQGNERQSVEIIADEIAPSLRWCTAQLTRASGGGNFGGGQAPQQGGFNNNDSAGFQGNAQQSNDAFGGNNPLQPF